MAENINGQDLLGSGGHVWSWGQANVTRKSVGSAAIKGEYSSVISIGARPGRIVGKDGPALLKATGASRALADSALSDLEDAIDTLIEYGTEVTWEDDQGTSGTALQLRSFNRAGPRRYGDGGKIVWQFYTLDVVELNGGW